MNYSDLQTRLISYAGRTGDTDYAALADDFINMAIRRIEQQHNFRHMRVRKTASLTNPTSVLTNPIPRYKSMDTVFVTDSGDQRYPVKKVPFIEAIGLYPNLTADLGTPKLICEYQYTDSLTLSRGTTDTSVASTAFTFTLNDTAYTKAAVAAGTALAAATVTADKWALWRFTINEAGTITCTGASGNAAGYATEALAIAACPAIPAQNVPMGYITVKTKSGLTFVANTDGLYGGTSGNVASVTHYYTEDVTSQNQQLLVRPTANNTFTLEIFGYQYSPELDGVVYTTNWWTENQWEIVLYGALLESSAYIEDTSKTALWQSLYDTRLKLLIDTEIREMYSTGATTTPSGMVV